MPSTLGLALTPVPADLVAALGLSAGVEYTVQNVGERRIFLAQAATAPADNSAHIIAAAGGYGVIKWNSGDPTIWAWAGDADGARLVATERS